MGDIPKSPTTANLTSLHRLASSVDTCFRPTFASVRWTGRPHYADLPCFSLPKKEAATEFETCLAGMPDTHTAILSEGTMQSDGDFMGWGFLIWRGQQGVARGHESQRDGEVFDVHALGALKHPLLLSGIREVTACVENQAVIWCLHRNSLKASMAKS